MITKKQFYHEFSKRLKKMTSNLIVSNQKIKTALNIDSLPITAEDGMKKTIESFILDKKWSLLKLNAHVK